MLGNTTLITFSANDLAEYYIGVDRQTIYRMRATRPPTKRVLDRTTDPPLVARGASEPQ